MSTLRFFGCALLLAFGSLASCAKAEPQGHLSAQDKAGPEDGEFNPDAIITLAEIADGTVRAETLRALVTYRAVEKNKKNPYGHDSFLAQYYSNGLSAIDALTNAAEQYKVNPIVILVRAQMEQGLVAMEHYPVDDPARVEYVFRCGCAGPSNCDPAYAGFDRQVDCIARQYRIIMNEMDANGGVTSGGWAKGRESRTVDGKSVTPVDEGTAIAYQFDPRVGTVNDGGSHLFWNIWKIYVKAAGYQGPAEDTTSGAWIGDPCAKTEQCGKIPGGLCITNYPGGMCTAKCREGACPVRENRESACIDTGDGPFCFPKCAPGATSCRGGSSEWACCTAPIFPQVPGVTSSICTPAAPGTAGCGG